MSKSKRVRILIITHSPALLTGMAETTRLIFNTLLQQYPNAYELHQIALNHFHAGVSADWPIYPTETVRSPGGQVHHAKADLHGEQTIRTLLVKLEPDIVFAFNDPQNLEHLCIDSSKREHTLVLYVNFDGFPVPPDYECLFQADRVITMSEFAKKAFLASHPSGPIEKVDFIYPPADTRRFETVSESEKMDLRRDLFPSWMSPSAFVLGWVGRNQWRKQVWILYTVIHLLRTGRYLLCPDCKRVTLTDSQASVRFPASGMPAGLNVCASHSCPHCGSMNAHLAEPLKDIFLWLHMARDVRQSVWPVGLLENLYSVVPGRDIHYTGGIGERSHFSPDDMPKLYQLWDALLYLSGGEGFGIPAWEAMSTGIPVIYTNYSSHAEFLTKAASGLPVGGTLQPEPASCILRLVANVSEALAAVRKLYFDRQLGMILGQNGRFFAEHYRTDIQVEKWHQTFQECMAAK